MKLLVLSLFAAMLQFANVQAHPFIPPEAAPPPAPPAPPAQGLFSAVWRTAVRGSISIQQQSTKHGVQLHTDNCALVLTDNNSKTVLWQSNVPNSNFACRIELQDDGNLAIYDEQDGVVWASNTNSIKSLRLDDDGVLRGYDANSTVVWSSHFTAERFSAV